jgi:hypothetical protein
MKIERGPVKSKAAVVGMAEYKIYDSVAECVQDIGEKETLETLNTQLKTFAMNRVRADATGKPSKAKLEGMALDRLLQTDIAKLQAVAGDPAARQKLIDDTVVVIEAELETERATRAKALQDQLAEAGEEAEA